MIITTTNVGSLGVGTFEELKPENIIVRHQLFDALAKINNEIDAIDLLALQECRTFDFQPSPFFDKPIADSSHVTWGKDEGGTRGTCIYAGKDSARIDLGDETHEACAASFSYISNNRKSKKAALINIYRNQSKKFTRTVSETTKFILKCMTKVRAELGIGKFVIVGDFNSTSVSIPGLKEYTHSEMYHKANKNSTKKFIDKIFSNISEVEIVSILPTCENKHGQENSSELGHKVISLRVGKAGKPDKTEIKSIRYSSLKKIVAGHVTHFNEIKLGQNTAENHHKIEEHCLDFTNLLVHLTAKATNTKMVDRKKGPKISLFQNIKSSGTEVLTVKEAAKEVYNLVRFMKTGIDSPTDKKKPELFEFRDHLQDKLKNLNKGDLNKAKAIIDQAYKNKKKAELRLPGRKKLKKILLATSSSGAKDHYGISLKVTKIFLRYNKAIANRFIHLAIACLKHGVFPDCWKQDVISFLFKKKGDYSLPKFWRPITIAVSLGKHMEKIVSFLLNQGNDLNAKNHAYTGGKSCLTAVLDLQKKLAEARKIKSSWQDQEIILGVGADDIASAFEPVDHRVIIYAIRMMFVSCETIKLDKVIESYLHRHSRVTDHDTGEILLVIRTFTYKTIPQGSILSPKLWRIYDLTFSLLYENSLSVLKIARCREIDPDFDASADDASAIADLRLEVNQSLICYTGTVAYADDHVTAVAVMVRKEIQFSVKREWVFRQIWTMRRLIKDATIDMGCDVEPSKSETIFSSKILENQNPDSRFKMSFKWLGYTLELKPNGILWFTEDAIDNKLSSQEHFARTLFQYSDCTAFRWKIWKTYFAPFVELYLPAVMQKSFGARSRVHTFQHRITCWALGLCEYASTDKLQIATGEPSVEFKARRAANRLLSTMGSKFDFAICRTANRHTLPSAQAIGLAPRSFNSTERKDLSFRMNLFVQSHWEKHKHVKFNVAKAKNFAKKENKRIQKRAALGWVNPED